MPATDAIYTIRFETMNPLPPSTAILITTPFGIQILKNDTTCFAFAKGRRDLDCRFEQSKLKLIGMFKDDEENFMGTIEINFSANNPPNADQGSSSLTLELYDSDDFQYGID